ncbi:hypothetical protein RND71_019208 [Anisodus tanguticus]|uniref:Uncharacterized protein n=1 Tax=Anisodus tanguticus TaxID=243964 RepID=A0AAE1RYN5_9SOLA|nr:hypothetical protein RND71_019208 [Anisodus tanguticus]
MGFVRKKWQEDLTELSSKRGPVVLYISFNEQEWTKGDSLTHANSDIPQNTTSIGDQIFGAHPPVEPLQRHHCTSTATGEPSGINYHRPTPPSILTISADLKGSSQGQWPDAPQEDIP